MQNIVRQTYVYLAFQQALKDLKLQKHREKLGQMLRPCITNMINIRLEALCCSQQEEKNKKDNGIAFEGKQVMNSQYEDQRFGNMKYRALVYDSPLSIDFQSSNKSKNAKNQEQARNNIFLLQLYCKDQKKKKGETKKKENKQKSKPKTKSLSVQPNIRQNPYRNESQIGIKKRKADQ